MDVVQHESEDIKKIIKEIMIKIEDIEKICKFITEYIKTKLSPEKLFELGLIGLS